MPASDVIMNLVRTLSSFFQIGGAAGVKLKNNSGALDVRNAADDGFVSVRAAADASDDNAVVVNSQIDGWKGVVKLPDIGTSATTDSTFEIPDGAEILRTTVHVKTAYDNSATLSVGWTADPDGYVQTSEVDLATVGVYKIEVPRTNGAGAAAAVRATIANSPTTGEADIFVEHCDAAV